MDESFCSPLGEYGERKNIDLLYSQSGHKEYSRFVASIFELLAGLTDELPRVPAVIIVWRQNSDTRVDILCGYEAKDRHVLRKDIYSLMDALSSSDTEKSLSTWQRRRQVRRFSVDHAPAVERILDFLKKYLGPVLSWASAWSRES